MSAPVKRLPTALESFFAVRPSRDWWLVELVTPARPRTIRTTVARFRDNAEAVDHATGIATQMQRPLNIGGCK